MSGRYSELREALGLDKIEPTTEAVFKLRLWEKRTLTHEDTVSYSNRLGTNLKEPFVCEGSYFIGEKYLYKIEIQPDNGGFNKFHLEYATEQTISSPTVVDGRVQGYGHSKVCKLHEGMNPDTLHALIVGRAFYNLMLYYYGCGTCEMGFVRKAINFGNVEVIEKVVKLSDKIYQEGKPRARAGERKGTKHSKHSSPRFHVRRYSNGKYVFVGDPDGAVVVHVYQV